MLYEENGRLLRRFDKELLCIEPWGKDSFRVRASMNGKIQDFEWSALLEPEKENARIKIDGTRAQISNGRVSCELLPSGKMRFYRDDKIVLEEYDRNRFREEEEGFNSALELDPRTFVPHRGTDNFALTVRFEADNTERIYGMGQYQQSCLDLKGCMIELAQRNSQASVPFMISNKGYGMLWNNPAVGKVFFGKNLTEWTAKSTKQLDYWITVGDTPAEIEENYASVTGTVPMMPEFAAGFWQCKLRYQTQDEIMKVAREYRRRNLPISVIVCDYFHWPYQGDWKFDPVYWPDPKKMVHELEAMGIKLMVSVWPTVEKDSENYKDLYERGMIARSEAGCRNHLGNASFLDVTNPETRSYVWNIIKKNYYDKGIRIFWLDEAEPEYTDYEYDQYRYQLGSDLEAGNVYPRLYAEMAYDGMTAAGQENVINLIRCAWAGSQRYGALVWSGDIDSSFAALRNQFAAGLNMGLAGIPWWTTDIGGFHGGNIHSPAFKECLVRWFQYGAFCPVFRLHGDRDPQQPPLSATGGGRTPSGADNEVWSYGDEVLKICTKYMELREKMRPYIMEQMKKAHEKGTPVMRPLFYDFPSDETCWKIEDEYMFGPDIVVCPLLYADAHSRLVYLPGGNWIELDTGKEYAGRSTFETASPIESMPVYIKKDSAVSKQLECCR